MTTEKMTKQYARKKDLKADKGAGNTKGFQPNDADQTDLNVEAVCQPICTQQPVSCDTVLHACDGIDKSGPVPTNKNANGGTVKIIRAQSRKSSQAAEKLVIGQSIKADEAFVNPPNKRAALGKNVVEGAHQKESGQVSSKGKSDAPQRKQLAVGNQGEKRKKVVFEKGECSTKKRKANTKTDSGMPHLLTRNKSYTLIQAFKGMSIEQRITVQSMGFEDLLEMNVAETPSTLSYWLLEAFDPRSCAVKLDHGRWLHVEDEDVTNVLGIPNGTSLFKRKAKNIPDPIVIDFRAFFDGDTNITSKRLANKMLTQDATSVWFKRMFLILITTCLVESCGNGYVATRLIQNFEDPDSAKELNWGQCMKKCLSETVRHWHDNKHLPFTGPLLFLLGLYVDRVYLYEQFVPRLYPSLKGWTCTLLRKREGYEISAGGLGSGFPVSRSKHVIEKIRTPPLDVTVPIVVAEANKTTEQPIEQSFAERFVRKSKLIAEAMAELIEMMKTYIYKHLIRTSDHRYQKFNNIPHNS
ncbi:hypothetical protein CASFOL_009198 [Castilleja foliolosa]|uniref:Uncharacterized protein n=1 Tax=Castilleja foliolosa TaxID=1961234 RepID=A0ABD3E0K4_9LAMI